MSKLTARPGIWAQVGRGKGGGDVSISDAERKPHTGVGGHRGLVLGISPPPPEHRGTIDDDSDDEDDENEEDDEHDSDLDGFEKGVIGALDTRLALKRPAAMKVMSAMKSMKVTKPMKGMKSMKAMKTMVTPMKLMTKEKPMKAMKSMKAMKAVKHMDLAPKKLVPGWSVAKRMKKYPKGCAKCRRCPGCTYSCFNYRGEIQYV